MDRFETMSGAPAPWRVRAAAVAVVLALAGPAGAAARTAPKAAPASAPAAAPAPQRAPARAAPVAPPPTAAPPPDGELPLDPTWRLGPALGLEIGIGSADFDGVGLRLDVERDVRRLSPEATLSFVASLAMTHAAGKENVAVLLDPFTGRVASGTVEWDANVLEAVPTARVTYQVAPAIALVGDGGVGLAWSAARARPSPSVAAAAPHDPVAGGFGGVVRLGGALVITPSSGLRIALEPIGLRLRFGNGPGSGYDLAFSISHRL